MNVIIEAFRTCTQADVIMVTGLIIIILLFGASICEVKERIRRRRQRRSGL